MKLRQVRHAEALRAAAINEMRRTLDNVFARIGDHENRDTWSLAVDLVDELDWDELAQVLEGKVPA